MEIYGRNMKQRLGTLLLTCLVLTACVQKTGQTPPSPQAGTTPDLSTLSAGLRVLRTVPQNAQQDVVSDTPISVTFDAPMNRDSAARNLNLFPGTYAPEANPLTSTPLKLDSLCNGNWLVTNPNAEPISFTWDLKDAKSKDADKVKVHVKGFGVVPGNATVPLYTLTGALDARVLVGGTLNARATQDLKDCDTTRTFTANADNTEITLIPTPQLQLGRYTAVVSTGAYSTTNQRLAEPQSFSFTVARLAEPPSDPVAEIDPDILGPVHFAGDDVFLSATGGADDLTYTWDFGDGTTSTGDAAAHQYLIPGRYTVKLTASNAIGQTAETSTTIAVMRNVHNMPNARASYSPLHTFDVGYPTEGLSYSWEMDDGTTLTGSKVAKTFDQPGFHDVKLVIRDAEQNVIEERETRVNYISQAPAGVIDIYFHGNGVATLDASRSWTANTLTYKWEFEGGVIGEGPQIDVNFPEVGRFPITLTVTDKNGQTDVAHQVIVSMNYGSLPNRTSVQYGATLQGMSASTSKHLQDPQVAAAVKKAQERAEKAVAYTKTVKGKAKGVALRHATRQGTLSAQAEGEGDYVQRWAVPYIVPTTGTTLSHVLSPTPLAGFVQGTASASFNGTPVPSGGAWQLQNCNPDTRMCPSAVINPSFYPSQFRAGSNTMRFTSNAQDESFFSTILPYHEVFETEFTAIAGLRVPRVVLSVLPSSQMEGETTVDEYSVTVDGKQELMAQVNVAEHVMTGGGYVGFRLPMYAVDEAGRLMSDANGIFFSRFKDPNIYSGPWDGTMVGGRTEMLVYVPVSAFADGTLQFDLSQVEVQGFSNCGTDTQYVSLYGVSQSGCTVMQTTPDLPLAAGASAGTLSSQTLTPQMGNGTTTARPYPYTVTPAAYRAQTNRVVAGRTPQERYAIERAQRFFDGPTVRLVIGFIPIVGDSVDLLEQAYNAASGKKVDPVIAVLATAGLAMDITTGGVGDFTAGLKGAYKVSLNLAKQGGGFLAETLADRVRALVAGKSSPSSTMAALSSQFVVVGKVFFKDGFQAVVYLDRLAFGLKNIPAVCPLSLSSQSCGGPFVFDTIKALANFAFSADFSRKDFFRALLKLTYKTSDGGNYTLGIEKLIAKSIDASKSPTQAEKLKLIKGIYGEAVAAQRIRELGGNLIELSRPILSGGKEIGEIDLVANFLGKTRVFEIKRYSTSSDDQLKRLANYANSNSARATYITGAKAVKKNPKTICELLVLGVDVLNDAYEVIEITKNGIKLSNPTSNDCIKPELLRVINP